MVLTFLRDGARRIRQVIQSSPQVRIGLIGLLLVSMLGLGAIQVLGSQADQSDNPIVVENQRAGSTGWESNALSTTQGKYSKNPDALRDHDDKTDSTSSTPRPEMTQGSQQSTATASSSDDLAQDSCTECWSDT